MSPDRRWPPDPLGTGAPPDGLLGSGPPPDSLLGSMDAVDLFNPAGEPARDVVQPLAQPYTQPVDVPVGQAPDPSIDWTAERLLGLPADPTGAAPAHLYSGPVPPPLRSTSGPITPGQAVTPRKPRGPKLRVDWPACRAHGLCVELLPERLHLDEWGYPIVDSTPVPPELMEVARRAAASCPTLALRIIDPA